MYIHAMKKLFLCALVLSILFQPSFSNEKITIYNSPNKLLDMQVHTEMLLKLGKKCVVNKPNKSVKSKTCRLFKMKKYLSQK